MLGGGLQQIPDLAGTNGHQRRRPLVHGGGALVATAGASSGGRGPS
jgi:hypothetical protein